MGRVRCHHSAPLWEQPGLGAAGTVNPRRSLTPQWRPGWIPAHHHSQFERVAGSIPSPEAKEAFVKNIDSLEIWVANARGIQFAATDIACNYEQLQRRYFLKVKHSDELRKELKSKGKDCYEELLDFAIECGLNMDSDFSNLKEVALKMLANSKDKNPEHLQIFFNLLELGREKRLIERDLKAIQNQKYGGPDLEVEHAKGSAQVSYIGFHDAP